MEPSVHESVVPLADLIGTWSGAGRGEYPTIDPFEYLETVTISHVGKPFLAYHQRTRHPSTHQPLHTEVGFWRMAAPSQVELVVAQPTGLVEVLVGRIESGVIRLRSSLVGRTPTAKEVAEVERDFTLLGDKLSYSLRMSAVGRELTHHLSGELHRVSSE